jgi:hypothetical protein
MSIKKVSELTSGSLILSEDLFYISQDLGGSGLVSKQITLDDIQRSFVYSIVKQDIGVEYGDTHKLGNASGGTFNSLYLGSGGLHIGYYDGITGTWSDTSLGYSQTYSGLTISNLNTGNFNDSALVINPTTNVVGTMPQGLRTIYGLYSQTGDSVNVSGTTVESTIIGPGIGTLSVPINGFSVGDSFRADFGGVMNASNNETIRIRVRSNGSVLLDSGDQDLGSSVIGDIFTLSINFTIRQIGTTGVASIVTLGRFDYAKTNNGTVQGFGFNTVNDTTFDTTVNNTLSVTIEWGSNSSLNNLYTDLFTLNKIY